MAANGAHTSFIDLTADSDSEDDPSAELEKLRASFGARNSRPPSDTVKPVSKSSIGASKPRSLPWLSDPPVKPVAMAAVRSAQEKANKTSLERGRGEDPPHRKGQLQPWSIRYSNTTSAQLQSEQATRSSKQNEESNVHGKHVGFNRTTPSNPVGETSPSTPTSTLHDNASLPPKPESSKAPQLHVFKFNRAPETQGIKRTADGTPKSPGSGNMTSTKIPDIATKHIDNLPIHASLHCPEATCHHIAKARPMLMHHLVTEHGWQRGPRNEGLTWLTATTISESHASRNSTSSESQPFTRSSQGLPNGVPHQSSFAPKNKSMSPTPLHQNSDAELLALARADSESEEEDPPQTKSDAESKDDPGDSTDADETESPSEERSEDEDSDPVLQSFQERPLRIVEYPDPPQSQPSIDELPPSKKPITIKLNTKPLSSQPSSRGTEETRRLSRKMAKALKHESNLVMKNGIANFIPEEDRLIVHLREELGLDWNDIYNYFPHRLSSISLKSRYTRCLDPRIRKRKTDTDTMPDTNYVPKAGPRRSERPNIDDASRKGLYTKRLRLGRKSRIENPTESEDSNIDTIEPAERSLPVNEFSGLKIAMLKEESNLGHAKMSGDIGDSHKQSLQGQPADPVAKALRKQRKHKRTVEREISERNRDSAAFASLTSRIFRSPVPETRYKHTTKPLKPKLQKKRSMDLQRPYLGLQERRYLQETIDTGIWDQHEVIKWDGKVLHVDFITEELESLEPSVLKVLSYLEVDNTLDLRFRLASLLRHASAAERSRIAARLQRKGPFINRTRDSIESVLLDLGTNHVSDMPCLRRIRLPNTTVSSPGQSIGRALRARELGASRAEERLRQQMSDSFGPALSFNGTSGDVNAISWSPDSRLFAVGSTAVTDVHSMQYNMPNNLLLGDIEDRTLRELPNHLIRRHRTEVGANSSREMFVSQDPFLFTTISSVQFSVDGKVMFSAGYDKYARIWDVRNGIKNAKRVQSIEHKGPIDLLAVGTRGLFATGAQGSGEATVRVWKCNLDNQATTSRVGSFYSKKAVSQPDLQLFPTSMRWNTYHRQLAGHLLCGFSSNAKDFTVGEAWVWNVETLHWHPINCARNIFDVTWSPTTFGRFAIGCTASAGVNKGIKSVIRIHDSYYTMNSAIEASSYVKPSYTYELECPALDMNDVVFNPHDENLISVGCTNGITYTWDIRNHHYILHQFGHGEALMPLDENRPREEVDTGVRFLSWDQHGRRLFTGSSDGVLTSWDPYRSTEDAHVQDVARLNSGIMSGAFSPDFSNLALGEVQGKVSFFAVGQQDKSVQDFEPLNLRRADEEKADIRRRYQAREEVPTDNESGIEAARQMLENLEIQIKPLADLPVRQAVQGPNYRGPYDKASDALERRLAAVDFQNRMQPSGDPCHLDHTIVKVTEEDMGDNGASRARIPGFYRSLGRDVPKACLRCGEDTLESNTAIQSNDTLRCDKCRLTWQADILGYTLIDDETLWPSESSSHVRRRATASDEEESAGEEYYHHLWQDRPPSPL